MWDHPDNHHLFTTTNLNSAKPLLDIMVMYDLKMALPPGIPILRANVTGNLTRPDNILCTSHLMDSIITCDTKEELMPTQTDHFPIIKELNLAPELTNTTPKRNFRTTDWKKFSAAPESKLQNLPMPKPIISKEEAQDRLDRLLEVIISTIEEKTPLSKLSPYAKRWWSAELDSANKNRKKIAYQAGQSPLLI
jgi:hypothetical protein